MQLIILLVVMSVLGVITIKAMKNEDSLIELEDKIIADIREFFIENKAAKNTAPVRKIEYRKEHCENRAA